MSIEINSQKILKKQHNFWNNILFHPTNAIEDDWGQRILDQIAEDKAADYVRIYTMFEDMVTKNEKGELVFDFSASDLRVDYLVSRGFDLVLTYGFFPSFLASSDDPSDWFRGRYKGNEFNTSPPNNYSEWEEICYQYTKHIVERYGMEKVSKWYLMCYNEPDFGFFMKSAKEKCREYDVDLPEKTIRVRMKEYAKVYSYFSDGVCRFSRELKIGGPAAARPLGVESFLENIKEYPNAKIDFISGHTYGTEPYWVNSGELPIRAGNNLMRVNAYVDVVNKFYPNKDMELMIDEWGMSGAGFYDLNQCPKFICRETEIFAAYFADMIIDYIDNNINISRTMICLSGQHDMKKDFTGYRNFFTLNFIKKPIYNMYIMARKLKENILEHAPVCDENLKMLATKDDAGGHAVMLTYRTPEFDGELADRDETVVIKGIEGTKKVTEWRIDKTHTNPYRLTLRENFPEKLSDEQLAILKEEGILKPVKEYEAYADGELRLDVTLTDNCVIMLEF